MVNFVGCIAFMVSAILAFVPSGGTVAGVVALSTHFTLLGSLGFVSGAVLAIRESRAVQE